MPSPDYAEIMMNENMLAKIDKNKISTYENIDKRVLKKLKDLIKEITMLLNKHYECYSNSCIYRKIPTLIQEITVSMTESDLKGRMTLLDDMKEVLIAGLGMEGYPQDTDSEEAMKKAAERMNRLGKIILQNLILNLLEKILPVKISGVQGYAKIYIWNFLIKYREHTDFVVPQKRRISFNRFLCYS